MKNKNEDFSGEDIGSEEDFRIPHELEFGPGNFEAIRHACEAIGSIIESWGFKKIMGSLWAFLYLCPEPASAKDISESLKISPALVSITLQDLIRWGVVKKISPLGKRRDYYIAEHDTWKMICRVFRERELNQLEQVEQKLNLAIEALDIEKESKPDLKSKRTCQFQRVRVEELIAITHLASGILESFTRDGEMNAKPLQSALQPYAHALKKVAM